MASWPEPLTDAPVEIQHLAGVVQECKPHSACFLSRVSHIHFQKLKIGFVTTCVTVVYSRKDQPLDHTAGWTECRTNHIMKWDSKVAQVSQLLVPVHIRHHSHHFTTQSSNFVNTLRAGWQAKMASIEFWIPWHNAHGHHLLGCLLYIRLQDGLLTKI